MARGGTLRIGDLHPVRGAGIDSPPEKSRGALGRLISKPGGSANFPPFLAAADSSLPEHRKSKAAPKSVGIAPLASVLRRVTKTHTNC